MRTLERYYLMRTTRSVLNALKVKTSLWKTLPAWNALSKIAFSVSHLSTAASAMMATC